MSPLLLALAVAVGAASASAPPQTPADIADRAEADFAAGRIAESVAGYDRLIALMPSVSPVLWQRGIGLYFLGRYEDCAAQFAAFNKVEANDMEDAAWHFLCVARAQSPERAQAALLSTGPDRRVMRWEIYEMCAGRMTPQQVLDIARPSVDIPRFYAHVYVGLYYDAIGNRAGALEHLAAAASDEYRDVGGFMNVVARIALDKVKNATMPLGR